MKILLLNPHIDAEHKIVQALRAEGHGVLLPMDMKEATQMLQLHGTSVELAVLHREGMSGTQDGIVFLNQLKANPAQSDLPVIVSSSMWGEAEFAQHQNTPNGAHAYLKWPFEADELLDLIDSMFGEVAEAPAPKPKASAAATPPAPGDGPELVLEDASGIFDRPVDEDTPSQFALEAPEFVDDSPAPLASAVSNAQKEKTSITLNLDTEDLQVQGTPSLSETLAPPQELPQVEAAAPEQSQELVQDPALEALLEAPVDPAAIQSPPPPEQTLSSVDIGALEEFSAPGEMQAELDAAPEALASAEENPVPDENAAVAETAEEAGDPVDDEDLAQEMPYLFAKKKSDSEAESQQVPSALVFAQPVGDAVVPGGAAQSPDVETLKKYLMLREQDVAVLSTQLKTAQEQVASLENLLKSERGHSGELQHVIDEQSRKIEEFEKEKALALEGLQGEINELRFQIKSKNDKGRVLEAQVREATEEIERVKERVRSDIRKIRVREKELENRLEIMKKDSEALIGARENKIIELKRKIDLLEFNMDLLQDQYSREKDTSARLRGRLARAAQVVRAAGGILDIPGAAGAVDSDDSSEEEAPSQTAGERTKAS